MKGCIRGNLKYVNMHHKCMFQVQQSNLFRSSIKPNRIFQLANNNTAFYKQIQYIVKLFRGAFRLPTFRNMFDSKMCNFRALPNEKMGRYYQCVKKWMFLIPFTEPLKKNRRETFRWNGEKSCELSVERGGFSTLKFIL